MIVAANYRNTGGESASAERNQDGTANNSNAQDALPV